MLTLGSQSQNPAGPLLENTHSALAAAAMGADLGSPNELRLSISANPWMSIVLPEYLTHGQVGPAPAQPCSREHYELSAARVH